MSQTVNPVFHRTRIEYSRVSDGILHDGIVEYNSKTGFYEQWEKPTSELRWEIVASKLNQKQLDGLLAHVKQTSAEHDQKIVYLAGAIRGDRAAGETLKQLVAFIKSLDTPVLTEHVGADQPDEVFSKKIGKASKETTDSDIEQQDIAWLDQATHLIAEVSGASTGTGREIEYGRVKGALGKTPAKVLCLYQKNREPSVSAMICGMTPDRYPNVWVSSYNDITEVKQLVKEFLSL